MKNEASLITGGFDPIHSGHLAYIKAASKFSTNLIVGLNSDEWLLRKKGYVFMPWKERKAILKNIKYINKVIKYDDSNDHSSNAIKKSLTLYEKVFFCNGGDRKEDNTPEQRFFGLNDRVIFKYGVGGNHKINSSSKITSNFIFNQASSLGRVHTPWGKHDLLKEDKSYKLKSLEVNPNECTSLQYHNHREEHWVVVSGKATIELNGEKAYRKAGEYIHIPIRAEHRILNLEKEVLVIVEVQLGDILEESDIVRIQDKYKRI